MSSNRFYASSALDTSRTSQNSLAASSELDSVVVVGLQLRRSVALRKAAETLGIEVTYSDTGLEFKNDSDITFVLEHFEGTSFKTLKECRRHRIISSGLLIYSAKKSQEIPYRVKPLYCVSMKGIYMAFDKVKSCDHKVVEKQSHWSALASYMGAILKPEVTSRITHLVSSNSTCDQYRRAASLDIPVMSWEWIYYSWERRNDFEFSAVSENVFNQFRWKPFKGLSLMFFHFTKEEKRNMASLTIENQGTVLSSASYCTHFVVNENNVKSLDGVNIPEEAYIVTSKWFWSSILIVARAEESLFGYPSEDWNASKERKFQQRPEPHLSRTESEQRRYVQDDLNKLVKEVDPEFGDLNSSDLDDPASPSRENQLHLQAGRQQIKDRAAVRGPRCKRENTVCELYKTECNYLAVLTTIVKKIKEGAENEFQRGGAILNPQESKELFEGIIPIRNLHLEIKAELEKLVNDWDGPRTVGDIFLERSDRLLKCYPQFINFFEATHKAIQTYRDKKPRFRAFLCLCQTFPECGKQSLEELMIRPVQRLPSVLLLLKEIEKMTPVEHRDSESLRAALIALDKVLQEINENKRQLESHLTLFNTVALVDKAPSTLLSESRWFVCRMDCVEVTDRLEMNGHLLTLFVFSDCLVITKKRSSSRSRQPYKYLETQEFRSIKRIVNILDGEGNTESIGVIVASTNDDIILMAFVLKDGDSFEKENFVKVLSTNICNFVCIAKPAEFVAARKNWELGLDSSNAPRRTNTLSRLLRRSGLNFGRSPSQNKGAFRAPAQPANDSHADFRASTFSLASTCSSVSTIAGFNLNESENVADDLNETVIHTPANRRRETFAERVNVFLANLGRCTPQPKKKTFLDGVVRSSSITSPSTKLTHNSSSASSSKGK